MYNIYFKLKNSVSGIYVLKILIISKHVEIQLKNPCHIDCYHPKKPCFWYVYTLSVTRCRSIIEKSVCGVSCSFFSIKTYRATSFNFLTTDRLLDNSKVPVNGLIEINALTNAVLVECTIGNIILLLLFLSPVSNMTLYL